VSVCPICRKETDQQFCPSCLDFIKRKLSPKVPILTGQQEKMSAEKKQTYFHLTEGNFECIVDSGEGLLDDILVEASSSIHPWYIVDKAKYLNAVGHTLERWTHREYINWLRS
jgi:hypothetical protein